MLLLILFFLIIMASGQEIPGKLYSYTCSAEKRDLCVGVSPGKQQVATNLPLQLKNKTNNELQGLDDEKLRSDFIYGVTNGTLRYSKDSNYCYQRRGRTSDLYLMEGGCNTTRAFWNTSKFLENAEQVAVLQHVATGLCATIMRCDLIYNKQLKIEYCDKDVYYPETSLKNMQRSAMIKLWPCSPRFRMAQTFRQREDCVPGCDAILQDNIECDPVCNTPLCNDDNGWCDSQSPTPPTGSPSLSPSLAPTSSSPSLRPSSKPSNRPSVSPSNNPSHTPSANPTTESPTSIPTGSPSRGPSSNPTPPSISPSVSPSYFPTTSPTASPANNDTVLLVIVAEWDKRWLLFLLLLLLCCCCPIFYMRRKKEEPPPPPEEEEEIGLEEFLSETNPEKPFRPDSDSPIVEVEVERVELNEAMLPNVDAIKLRKGGSLVRVVDTTNKNYTRIEGTNSFRFVTDKYGPEEIPSENLDRVVEQIKTNQLKKS